MYLAKQQHSHQAFSTPPSGDVNAWIIATLMNLQQEQQAQFKKQDKIAERNVSRLEAADERKLRQNSACVALTDVQSSLMHLMLMPERDIAGKQFYLSQLEFSPTM